MDIINTAENVIERAAKISEQAHGFLDKSKKATREMDMINEVFQKAGPKLKELQINYLQARYNHLRDVSEEALTLSQGYAETAVIMVERAQASLEAA